eukprot:6172141-Alexandrium_andersonii.AAC.1
MSASLVGSEMCIRDRPPHLAHCPPSRVFRSHRSKEAKARQREAASDHRKERKIAASETACWRCPVCQQENQIARWN